MLSAEELKFSVAHGRDLPAWLAGPSRQLLQIWAPSDHRTATLRAGGESVLVLVRERSSLFVGEITGFAPNGGDHFRGMSVGDLIVFRQSHVFEASP
jgi:hypothetical protein